MTVKLGVEDIGTILDSMVQNLHQKFGEQLVSVVIYGSYAREAATRRSDIDLLMVVRTLPRDWRSIHRLEDELMLKGRRSGKRFQITLATPGDVLDSVEYAAPMMLEIYYAMDSGPRPYIWWPYRLWDSTPWNPWMKRRIWAMPEIKVLAYMSSS